MTHTRLYRCTNVGCPRFGEELEVAGTPIGPFFDWPNLKCICGMEPMLIAQLEHHEQPEWMGMVGHKEDLTGGYSYSHHVKWEDVRHRHQEGGQHGKSQ
jgi:hypothetical protein